MILIFDREQFEALPATEKKRPSKTLEITHQNLEIKPSESGLSHIRNIGSLIFYLNLIFKVDISDELKTMIYLINKEYGVGAANDISVTLKLKNKMPSQHFKTKKDFLAQLRIALLKEPKKKRQTE